MTCWCSSRSGQFFHQILLFFTNRNCWCQTKGKKGIFAATAMEKYAIVVDSYLFSLSFISWSAVISCYKCNCVFFSHRQLDMMLSNVHDTPIIICTKNIWEKIGPKYFWQFGHEIVSWAHYFLIIYFQAVHEVWSKWSDVTEVISQLYPASKGLVKFWFRHTAQAR